MRVAHKWDKVKAARVVADFNLRKARQNVEPEKRKTKKRPAPRHRFTCMFKYKDGNTCNANVVNIRQHCRQQHGLHGKRLAKHQQNALSALIQTNLSTEEESNAESDEDEREESEARAKITVDLLGMNFGERSENVRSKERINFLKAKFSKDDDSPDFLADDYCQNAIRADQTGVTMRIQVHLKSVIFMISL